MTRQVAYRFETCQLKRCEEADKEASGGSRAPEGPQTNHASFYGPEKVKRPFVAYFLFSFSCMALPLDPLGQSVRHGIYWTELPLPLPHTPPTARPHLPHPIP